MSKTFIPSSFLVAAASLAAAAIGGATVGYIQNQSVDPAPARQASTRTPVPSFTATPTARQTQPSTNREDNGKDHDQANRDPRVISKFHDPSHPKKVTPSHPKVTIHKTPAAKATTPSTTRLAPQSDEPVNPVPATPAGEDIATNREPIPVTDPNQQPVKPSPQETTQPPAPQIPVPVR